MSLGLPSLRAVLEREGLWADKGLGQHFLLDPEINRRIAALAPEVAGRVVLEVGPGPGGLTRALLEAGAKRVVAIERDRRFAPILAEIAEAVPGGVEVHLGDALEANAAALLASAGAEPPTPIVANLPYNVGTALLVNWLHAGSWRGAMTLMFQKEVAQRIVATPGTAAYGRLAVLAQSACAVRILMHLPPRAFTPAPKVASAVVRLTPLAAPYARLALLGRVTAAAFGQRRKMLRSSLASLGGPDLAAAALEKAGIAPTLRAETISVAGFHALAEAAARLQPSLNSAETNDGSQD